jgi:hypothetical protein
LRLDELCLHAVEAGHIFRLPRPLESLALRLDLLTERITLRAEFWRDLVGRLRGAALEGRHQRRDRRERFVGRPHRDTQALIEIAALRLLQLVEHLVERNVRGLHRPHRFVERGHILFLLPDTQLLVRLGELIAARLARRVHRLGQRRPNAVDRLVEQLGA